MEVNQLNILDILREAKDPDNKSSKINVTADVNEAEDYSADVEDASSDNVDSDESADDIDTTSDETEEVTDDTETEETTDDDNTSDDSEDSSADDIGEPTDYSEEADDMSSDDDSSNMDDVQSDDTSMDQSDNDESSDDNRVLKNDMIELYDSIKNTVDKLDSIEFLDVVSLKIVIRAKQQMNDLSEYLYTYITSAFDKKVYAENLYTYRYIVELYKISVQMLQKIRTFSRNS